MILKIREYTAHISAGLYLSSPTDHNASAASSRPFTSLGIVYRHRAQKSDICPYNGANKVCSRRKSFVKEEKKLVSMVNFVELASVRAACQGEAEGVDGNVEKIRD